MSWEFDERHDHLLTDLVRIDGSLRTMLEDVAAEVTVFDSELWSNWRRDRLLEKVSAYAVRYIVPLYELIRREKSAEGVAPLVVQLLACVVWRQFDNTVDGHMPVIEAHAGASQSLLQLVEYAQRHANVDLSAELKYHYETMASAAIVERHRPVALNNIWTRCSIFLLSAESVARLGSRSIELLKCYLNYSGVAHDTHDLLADVSNGVYSLPVAWFREISPDEVFSVQTVRALYDRVRSEVKTLEESFEGLCAGELPLIRCLWNDSHHSIHDE